MFIPLLLLRALAPAKDKPPEPPALRWTEGKPGCTFSRDDDGKEKLETQLQDYQRQVSELTEFINIHSLRARTLDPGNTEVSGWVFFSAKDKWIGDWRKPEEFLLRIPPSDRIFEFPFTMPPAGKDDFILRRRPN